MKELKRETVCRSPFALMSLETAVEKSASLCPLSSCSGALSPFNCWVEMKIWKSPFQWEHVKYHKYHSIRPKASEQLLLWEKGGLSARIGLQPFTAGVHFSLLRFAVLDPWGTWFCRTLLEDAWRACFSSKTEPLMRSFMQKKLLVIRSLRKSNKYYYYYYIIGRPSVFLTFFLYIYYNTRNLYVLIFQSDSDLFKQHWSRVGDMFTMVQYATTHCFVQILHRLVEDWACLFREPAVCPRPFSLAPTSKYPSLGKFHC